MKKAFFHIPAHASFLHVVANLSSYETRSLGHIFYITHRDLWFILKVLKTFLFKCGSSAIWRKDSLAYCRDVLQILSMALTVFIFISYGASLAMVNTETVQFTGT